MKRKIFLLLAVLQCLFGLLALGSFAVLAAGGEPVGRWLPALAASLLMLASGILELVWRD